MFKEGDKVKLIKPCKCDFWLNGIGPCKKTFGSGTELTVMEIGKFDDRGTRKEIKLRRNEKSHCAFFINQIVKPEESITEEFLTKLKGGSDEGKD